MVKLIEDNDLPDHSLDTVSTHLETQTEKWLSCGYAAHMITAICSERQAERTRIVGLIDAFRSESGEHLYSVQDLVQDYIGILPAV